MRLHHCAIALLVLGGTAMTAASDEGMWLLNDPPRQQLKDKYKFELGGGCTGVMAPGLYPLLRSGQINGLIGGLRGAAEYETLIDQKGRAIAGMDAQSATHLAIIVLVIICNLFYFSLRKQGRQQGYSGG